MFNETIGWSVVSGLLAATLALPGQAGASPAQGSAAALRATIPNALVVSNWHSWCGGTRVETHQINGPYNPSAPTVLIHRSKHTLECFF